MSIAVGSKRIAVRSEKEKLRSSYFLNVAVSLEMHLYITYEWAYRLLKSHGHTTYARNRSKKGADHFNCEGELGKKKKFCVRG